LHQINAPNLDKGPIRLALNIVKMNRVNILVKLACM
jgi:hypothetical protein